MKFNRLIIIFSALITVFAIHVLAAEDEKQVTMYAPDGRTKQVAESQVENEIKVGWFTEKPIIMYAADGRTKYVIPSRVEAEKKVGWYTEPVIYMYAADGRKIIVRKSLIESYKSVGWYENEDDTYQWIYSLSSTKYVLKAKIADWVKVGWSTTPYPILLNASFENNSPENSCIDLNIHVKNINTSYKAIASFEFDACYFDEAGKPLYDLYGANYRHVKYDCPPLCWYSDGTSHTDFFANIEGCFKIQIKNVSVTYTDGTSETIGSFIYALKTHI